MKQETAIEWFVDELQRAGWIPKDSSIMNYVILEAKKMEKEQIIEFTNDYILTQCGASFEGNVEAGMLIEEYYKLTFKSE